MRFDGGIRSIHTKYTYITQDKKEKDPKKDFKREEELLEQAVQPHKNPLGLAFIPVLLFTRFDIERATTLQSCRVKTSRCCRIHRV